MDNEVYRDLSHTQAIDELYRHFALRGQPVAREVKLANGRIADVMTIDIHGDIHIVEVKTLFKATYFRDAWDKYHLDCNQLWLAVSGVADVSVMLDTRSWLEFSPGRYMGFAGVYPCSVVEYSRPIRHVLSAKKVHHALEAFTKSLTRG